VQPPVRALSSTGIVLSGEYTVADEEKRIFFTPCAAIVWQRWMVVPRLLL
jgi:hypothetical protein